jgi:hypothetical protein
MKYAITFLACMMALSVNAQHKQPQNPDAFKNMLGVNAFEWDFLQDPKNPNDATKIFEPKMDIIRSFGGVRHYLDWEKIEPEKGHFTFNPARSGGWNYDIIYERCKQEGIDVLACIKGCPNWLMERTGMTLHPILKKLKWLSSLLQGMGVMCMSTLNY